MSDIVERLRLLVPSDSSGAAFDAVNEIATLRAEVASKNDEFQKYARRMESDMNELGGKNARLTARIRELEGALEWYREQAEGCRKLGSIGDPYRQALDADGGKRATAALKGETNGN